MNFTKKNYKKYITEAAEEQKEESLVPAPKDRAETLKATYAAKKDINQQDIVDLLNVAIVDELLAAFNYFSSFALSKTEGKADFDPEFHAHYQEELGHAEMLVQRINELGSPVMTISIKNYCELNSVGDRWQQQKEQPSLEMLKNRRDEEIDAVSFYKFILQMLDRMKNETKNWDSTTEQLVKKILADEEEHLYDLTQLLVQYEGGTENA